jgi:hypothetical protein
MPPSGAEFLDHDFMLRPEAWANRKHEDAARICDAATYVGLPISRMVDRGRITNHRIGTATARNAASWFAQLRNLRGVSMR